MRVYLAGPMTGIPQFNYPAFDAAAAALRRDGHKVVSPAELDDPETRKAALASPDGRPGSGTVNGETWGDFLARDVKLVADEVDAVVVLDGWEKSRGAKLETFVAGLCDKPVLRYPDLKPIDRGPAEVRVVNEKTGGAKGMKAQRFELLPWEALGEIAEVYDFGARKYAPHNWRKGYDWSLSFGALQRHLALFWAGHDLDEETGLPHIAHAGFHVLALLTFMREQQDLDDRFKEAA